MVTDTGAFASSARILADSVSPLGYRLTTFEVKLHRFVLAELNTHRSMSRNSASSRAIPYQKMRQKALEQTAYPVSWPQEQRGMQGGEELPERTEISCRAVWGNAVEKAVAYADQLHGMGVHKSVCNRLLEPFIPHTVIITATDLDGFWKQRCHPDAQLEIRVAAEAMKRVYDESTPEPIYPGGWHLPLVDLNEDSEQIIKLIESRGGPVDAPSVLEVLKAVSVARCARVSYLTHDGVRDIAKDLELFERLRGHTPPHASPFEHVATPAHQSDTPGNFRGWYQFRHLLGLG